MKTLGKVLFLITTFIAFCVFFRMDLSDEQYWGKAYGQSDIQNLIVRNRLLFHSVTHGYCAGIDFNPATGEIEMWDKAGRISLREMITLRDAVE